MDHGFIRFHWCALLRRQFRWLQSSSGRQSLPSARQGRTAQHTATRCQLQSLFLFTHVEHACFNGCDAAWLPRWSSQNSCTHSSSQLVDIANCSTQEHTSNPNISPLSHIHCGPHPLNRLRHDSAPKLELAIQRRDFAYCGRSRWNCSRHSGARGECADLGDSAGAVCAVSHGLVIIAAHIGGATVVGRVQSECLLIGSRAQQAGVLQQQPERNHVAQHPACTHLSNATSAQAWTKSWHICCHGEIVFAQHQACTCSERCRISRNVDAQHVSRCAAGRIVLCMATSLCMYMKGWQGDQA